MGYRGTNQFWFGIKPTWTGSTDSRGFETDGDLNQTGYPANNATPVSSWAVYNATLIGRGKTANTAAMGGGAGLEARTMLSTVLGRVRAVPQGLVEHEALRALRELAGEA